jgi:hypothetical protein
LQKIGAPCLLEQVEQVVNMCSNKRLKTNEKIAVIQLLNLHEQVVSKWTLFWGQVSKWLDGERECPTMQL